jgi:arylsulfatase A-like enzyme
LPIVLTGDKLMAMRVDEQSPDAIAMISIDSLPAWMIPAFGCAWVAMPNLDRLAGRGVVLDRVMATSDDTHETLGALAGRCSSITQGTALPALMTAANREHATTLVTDDTRLAHMTRGPANVHLVAHADESSPASTAAGTHFGRLFDAAADLIARGDHRFVWCHASSLGGTWDAPVSFRDRYVDPDDPPPPAGTRVPTMHVGPDTDPDILVAIRHAFAGQLTLLDHCLGTLLTAIAARSERWTILVTATRGLGLGLHDAVGRAPMLPFSEVMQLPAILVDHRERMAGQRYGGLLTPDDLGATVIDMLGSSPEPSSDPRHGRSLRSLLEAWHLPTRDRVIARSELGAAIATPSWHLVQPNGDAPSWSPARLFAKPDDFFEACDVADRCPAVADELASLVRGDLQHAWTIPLSHHAIHGV